MLLLLTLAGCSLQPVSVNHPNEPVEDVTNVADAPRRPIAPSAGAAIAETSNPGRLPPGEEEFLLIAEEQLVSRCMEARGFQYVALVAPEEEPRPVSLYGNDDVESARQNGYGISSPVDSAIDDFARNNPNQQHVESLPTAEQNAWNAALTGTDGARVEVTLSDGRRLFTNADGCVAQVRAELYGDLASHMRIKYTARAIEEAAYIRVVADPIYLSALREWADCMTAKGYRLETPDAAREYVWEEFERSGEVVRDLEFQVALAEAECTQKSKLERVAAELEERYRQEETVAREGELLAYLEQQQQALEKARGLLERS